MKPQEYTHFNTHVVAHLEPEDTNPGEHQIKILLKQTDGLLAENKRLRVELRMSRDQGIKFITRMFPLGGLAQICGIAYAAYNQNPAGAINITVSLLYMTAAVTYLFTRRKYERTE